MQITVSQVDVDVAGAMPNRDRNEQDNSGQPPSINGDRLRASATGPRHALILVDVKRDR